MTDTPVRNITKLTLDEKSVVRRSAEVEHERAVAIYDLLEENLFRPDGLGDGPFHLRLRIEDNRLIFSILPDGEEEVLQELMLPLSKFRKIVRDYFLICESYFEAIKTATLAQIEAIDMGRRGIHNEGAELLRERLTSSDIEVDVDTSRRLFTLVCVLHFRA
ncbi:MAG: UPF0262 family protein [Alphaproteobacteria bacterium]